MKNLLMLSALSASLFLVPHHASALSTQALDRLPLPALQPYRPMRDPGLRTDIERSSRAFRFLADLLLRDSEEGRLRLK